ncbi:ATP-binding protein [Hyalangium sp.]|uniref:hybrid sensor histidine kinase/response regulator n=1 Tax=Hyalangium sp. TaxID=2028555 RepID=UPI002D220B01|nr:ATP-binding protein [Hyalangium sp.]HYH95044.1 ATP-binding protein [Hyalangium sp.]
MNHALPDLLEVSRDALLERWSQQMQQLLAPRELSREQLIDSLPVFLQEVASALRREAGQPGDSQLPAHSAVAEEHGRQRMRLGFDAALVLREYALVRECLLELLELQGLEPALQQVRLLLRCLDTGAFEAVLPFARAAAAREAAEQALALERARLQAVLDNIPAGVLLAEAPSGRITLANRQVERILRHPLPAMAGVEEYSKWKAFHPDGQPMAAHERPMARALRGETTVGDDLLYQRGESERVWLRVGGAPIRDMAGCVTGGVVVFYDRDTEKRAEAALRESEARFRNMADSAPVMLWVTDTLGACTYLNKGWYEFTGQTEQTGLGLGWLSVLHPEDSTRAGEIFLAANAKREPFRIEYRVRRKDGAYRWAIDSASPRFSPEGEFLGYVGSVIDITDRKQAEHEREQLLARESEARQAAEEANRLKDEFLATVSHELRTPLTSMLGWVQLMRTGGLAPEKRERALETIERNARAQAQLIEDLLDVSRIMTGKLKLGVEPVEVSVIVEQALDSVRPAAEARGIRLQAAVDSTSHVMGDSQRLQQVVWNLLSNAVKFTPKGGRVQVFVERRDSSVEITVADTGQGICREFLPHLFERFRQAEAGTTRTAGGLGLGLSIVRNLVEMHGGTVSASSEGDGKGATFTVQLPVSVALRREVAVRPGLQLPVAQGEVCPPELASLRVLVVDDEGDTRELLRAMLEGCKAHVLTAASAAEGLALLRAERPDLLISDIGMPGEDGYSLISRVRALSPEQGGRTPAVALTAYTRVEDRTRVLLAGFHSHVPKPVEPLELLAVLASLAGRTQGGSR